MSLGLHCMFSALIASKICMWICDTEHGVLYALMELVSRMYSQFHCLQTRRGFAEPGMHRIEYNTPQHSCSGILFKPVLNYSIPTRCLADWRRILPLQIWRELLLLEWGAASLGEQHPLRTSGRCYARDALDMGLFPQADMKLRPGTIPAMNEKERYEYPHLHFSLLF